MTSKQLFGRFTIVVLAAFLLQLLAGALIAPASAHAKLVGTIPSNGQTVESAPRFVEVSFDEPIVPASDGIRVFDGDAKRVDVGKTRVVDQSRAHVDVGQLSPGGYVMTWRMISADGHPVRGATTFQVVSGDVSETKALATELFNSGGESAEVGVAYAIARFVAFTAIVLAVGLLALLGISRFDDRVLRRAAEISLLVLGVGGLVELVLHNIYVSGKSFDAALDGDVWESAMNSQFTWMIAGRSAVSLLAFALIGEVFKQKAQLVGASKSRWQSRAVLTFAGVVITAVVVTTTFARHAVTGRYPVIGAVADVVHIGAASVWVGGLVALLLSVLKTRTEQAARDKGVLLRYFSSIATVCVVLIAVSGVTQGWRQVGSIDALFDSSYGWIVVIKAALFGVMIGMASFGRTRIRYELEKSDNTSALKSVRVQTAFEIFVAVLILGATSLLVNAEPPRMTSGDSVGFSAEVNVGDRIAQVVVDPAVAGSNTFHIYTLSTAGAPEGVESAELQILLPEKGIERLEIPLRKLTPEHYIADNFSVPIADKWEAVVTVQISPTDRVTETVGVRIDRN